jgi:hypothetical protein
MKIFLSWSGFKSRSVAEALRVWLPAVIQAARPYFSPDDVAKGARWNTEIAKELEESKVGVICLTKENLEAPWLMFETGALAKSLDRSRVVPLLLDVEPADMSGPLSQFQAARFDKADIKRLVKLINEELAAQALESTVLDSVFEKWWPELEGKVAATLKAPDIPQTGSTRSDREVLEEVLVLVRDLSFRRSSSIGSLSYPASGLDQETYYTPVSSLQLTERAEQHLDSAGIRVLGELVQRTEMEVLRIPNLGRKSLNEIKEALENRGLSLARRNDG